MRLKWLRIPEIHHAPGSIIASAETKVGLFEIRCDPDGWQTLLLNGEEVWGDDDVSSRAESVYRGMVNEYRKRRFMASVAAMQGLCANPGMAHIQSVRLAIIAADHADALLKELGKEDNE